MATLRNIMARLRLCAKLLSGRNFLLVTKKGEQWEVANTFDRSEISVSIKAFYLQ